MSDIVIKAENLSKLYRIGKQESYRTLRDSISQGFSKLFSRQNEPKSKTDLENTIWALKDVSFEIKQGEVVGIIGRNGAGKSTLLKILSRITEPTEGSAEIYGRVASLLEVGTGFHSELTGRENIYLNAAILGMKKREIEKKFEAIVAFAEVEKFIDTPVKHYSSGMHMRLAFAVAAHLNPDILLVDEVLAVGDIEFQKKCVGKMERVSNEGRTVVVVSHSMSTIKAICSKSILLEKGVVKMSGEVNAVVAAYLMANPIDVAEKIVYDADYVAGGDRMRIKRIKLLNAVANKFSVHWQQPILVAVEMEIPEKIEDVSFGAGIKMLDGSWILCAHHDDHHEPRWNLLPGKYLVKFSLQNNLRPGIYKLAVGGHSHHFSKNLCQVEAVILEVLDHTEGDSVPFIYNSGIVNGDLKCESLERIA